MPAVSGKQYRAMQAAAHGHSTLGIPQKVGKEFAEATPPSDRSKWSGHAKRIARARNGK
jgi:hypothetical protein